MRDPASLNDIAAAVADGTAVDWPGLVAKAESQASRDEMAGLQLVALIADVHGSASWTDRPDNRHPQRSFPAASASHDTGDEGDSWGPLRILELIGHGSFGDVYRAWDPRLEREVALKLLRGETNRATTSDAARHAALIHEARLLARVRHPGVATVFAADHIDGRTGLWMELVRGHTLEIELTRGGPFSAEEIVRCGHAVADALAAVHRAGFVHRDVKTQNLMYDHERRIVLMDFGTGLEQVASSGSGGFAGTPLYVAPEILAGAPPTPQADLYSLGVVLFRLATGKFPVPGQTMEELRSAHRRGLRRRLSVLRPDLPLPVAGLIERALQPSPSSRFVSADEMRDALLSVRMRAADAPAPARAVVLPANTRSIRAFTMLLGLAAAIVLVVSGLAGSTPSSLAPAVAPHDWVLVTSLENATGNSMFDGAVEHVLRQELASSDMVRVASPERVRDALVLMRRPSDTKIDVAVGREVSVRDGGIRALVAPRLDRLGTRLRLSVDIVAPDDGRIVATEARFVNNETRVLEAAVWHARWVRRGLGGRGPELSATVGLARATTSSLQALHLYSKAVDLGMQRQWAAAIKLVETAIQHDPQFASAHILHAWGLANTGASFPDVLAAAERARALAAHGTEPEKYFIEGSYLTMLGSAPGANEPYARFAEAAAAFEVLLLLEPGHEWGALNLLNHYRSLQRSEDALRLAVEMAALRPNNLPMQVQAAQALVTVQGDLAAASRHVARASALVEAGAPADPQQTLWVVLFEAHQAWADGNIERALEMTNRHAAALPTLAGPALEQTAQRVGAMYLTLGRCREARAAMERMHPDIRHEALALLSWDCGEVSQFDSYMRADAAESPDPSFFRVMWGARGGNVAQAERWVDEFRRLHANRIVLAVADGEVAFATGDWTTAVARLEAAWMMLKEGGQDRTCRVAERLAAAYQRTGRTDRALEVIEATIPMRPRLHDVSGMHGGTSWIHAQVALANLYRSLNRSADALQVEGVVRSLLRAADPEFPVVSALKSGRDQR